MKAKLEVETKIELDAAGFKTILASGELKASIEQINHYFDDHWKLADHASTLRVRLTKIKKPQVTFKTPIKTDRGKRTCEEIEFEMDSKTLECILSGQMDFVDVLPSSVHKCLDELDIRELKYVGSVKNHRYVIQTKHGTIEADHLNLPGGYDYYEAEIESDYALVHRRLVEFISKLVPTAHPSNISKFERFRQAVARLVEMQGEGQAQQHLS